MKHRYLIALGSNVRHRRHGAPERVLRAALARLDDADGIRAKAVSPIFRSAPLGPSRRRYANAAAVLATRLGPDELLRHLKALERHFGRKRGGRRWAARVLDLDIVLWDGGCWSAGGLTIPHVAYRERRFVLDPASAVARGWRDPLTHLTVAHLRARLTKPRPVRNDPAWSGP